MLLLCRWSSASSRRTRRSRLLDSFFKAIYYCCVGGVPRVRGARADPDTGFGPRAAPRRRAGTKKVNFVPVPVKQVNWTRKLCSSTSKASKLDSDLALRRGDVQVLSLLLSLLALLVLVQKYKY
jgi:hypothetical protein